jgi:hypothetical protein
VIVGEIRLKKKIGPILQIKVLCSKHEMFRSQVLKYYICVIGACFTPAVVLV